MSDRFKIFDEDEFQEKVCGSCKNKEICGEWEFHSQITLYANKVRGTEQLFVADDGKTGVYRCASYDANEDCKCEEDCCDE